ncbi:Sugar (pentulose or hexulose) kinase [Meinhardsimonia xiamenensis]|jgi:sugar (pentulose or hexulose) kinase|uniref:Sugar (Pentulose or hexulose) kinase n=1 Tax=Meinhardsimonia xiamenensis TaxID=990712 RepID=A0A1G9FHM8_9RHOB|nr:FGGY-family carbohydrate kinase [Meinhardsimonia xiamenensis]PRX37842.1 sugar (pentulose or hexulose) kinase [Meinhardsimonia xiamenensis]SDK87862.1 Sugar (pentulose or hexulose) kinase [Meinhardsimonia xiamenensis]
MGRDNIAVIDIGKTNVKLALVDPAALTEIAVLKRPNRMQPGPPWPHFDTEGIWAFLCEGLARLHEGHGIGRIVVTTHGAAGAFVDGSGALAAPVLDYEHDGPDRVAAEYDRIRPPFAETGSPRLAHGLNLGAQVFWQLQAMPQLRRRARLFLPWPQYWAFRLSGVPASDVTSLGCHTDLWQPHAGRFSSLVARLDLGGLIAPPRRPSEILGPILPEIAHQTGLEPSTPVHCGIHDSNASLLPHLLANRPPFSVVSTGTWVIAMAVGGRAVTLDPARDTLINVNALGAPVPSARFMGGREHDLLGAADCPEADAQAMQRVLESGTMLLPAVVSECGPFPGRQARWTGPEPEAGTAERAAAVAFYLAMMTATCLELAGHAGPIIVEGPFARNRAWLAMLQAAMQAPVRPVTSATGTSVGAALLALDAGAPVKPPASEAPPHSPGDPLPGVTPQLAARLRAHAKAWRQVSERAG